MIFRKYLKLTLPVLAFASLFLGACSQSGQGSSSPNGQLVHSQEEYEQAVKELTPGDTLVLANGVWNDFEILFVGQGTEEQPITLTAESKGEVILSGQSNLRIAGAYLVVSGLVFKNGYTPTDSVISYRRSSTELAFNSRITETVIDNFSNPERTETDYWVAMYGKNNRFDHNHLEGKRNAGVTLAVRLNTEESLENHHRIDHNYFGPRPILGSNGGETLRIGTSAYSLSNSYTLIENNYFDRCDGELEIISNKSGSNIIRGNVFFESRGTLTLRHGSGNLVEDNVFFGNGVDHTGGIRVINGEQTIRNNYMEGLAGYRFGGALVVMNGVPNSPINRYHQVKNALIENNSLIESDHIQLAAGSDPERSAVPVDSIFRNNLIFSSSGEKIFTVYDDVSGIAFEHNFQNKVEDFGSSHGFVNSGIEMERAANGLMYPTSADTDTYGVSRTLSPVKKEQTGVSWYAKSSASSKFDGGKVIEVSPGLDTLAEAVKSANAGDVLMLAPGKYVISRILEIKQPISIFSSVPRVSGQGTVDIVFERTALFEIQNGGSLYLKGLQISGAESPDSTGNSLIRTQRSSMLVNYDLIIENSEITDLNVNNSFNVLTVAKSTFADRIEIRNSVFKNISGDILKLDSEIDDYGIYNAEYVKITDSNFESVQGALTEIYRGGTDESTFGPHFELTGSALNQVGNGSRNKSSASIFLQGVQVTNIQRNAIANSPAIRVNHTVGEPVTRITDNQFVETPAPEILELNSKEENTAFLLNNSYR